MGMISQLWKSSLLKINALSCQVQTQTQVQTQVKNQVQTQVQTVPQSGDWMRGWRSQIPGSVSHLTLAQPTR